MYFIPVVYFKQTTWLFNWKGKGTFEKKKFPATGISYTHVSDDFWLQEKMNKMRNFYICI